MPDDSEAVKVPEFLQRLDDAIRLLSFFGYRVVAPKAPKRPTSYNCPGGGVRIWTWQDRHARPGVAVCPECGSQVCVTVYGLLFKHRPGYRVVRPCNAVATAGGAVWRCPKPFGHLGLHGGVAQVGDGSWVDRTWSTG